MRKHLLLSSFAALLMAAVAAAYADAQPPDATSPLAPPAATGRAAELLKPGPLPEMMMGKADAPVTIVEYADLSCPHCAHFHHDVLPKVKAKYIDTGKARLLFREFPLNSHSLIAFMSVRCAPPQAAFPLISALFKSQSDWIKAASLPALADKLFPFAQQVGLTRAAFDACVPHSDATTSDKQKQLIDAITKVRERGHNVFGVNATPTFFVNGEKLSGAGIDDFDKAIAKALKP
ncbi:MAG TPA: DsbA family protein [Hyphomicrobiaceae bacterium]|nr:DsbA family protein [Hyphomicrobiaceae bacterium]